MEPVIAASCNQPSKIVRLMYSWILCLLTHICISVAMNIVVHPQLTCEHQSSYHQGLHTQLCNPSGCRADFFKP